MTCVSPVLKRLMPDFRTVWPLWEEAVERMCRRFRVGYPLLLPVDEGRARGPMSVIGAKAEVTPADGNFRV